MSVTTTVSNTVVNPTKKVVNPKTIARRAINKDSKQRLMNVKLVYNDFMKSVLGLPNRVKKSHITSNVLQLLQDHASSTFDDKTIYVERLPKLLSSFNEHTKFMTNSQRLSYLESNKASTTTKLIDAIIKGATMRVKDFNIVNSVSIDNLPTIEALIDAKELRAKAKAAKDAKKQDLMQGLIDRGLNGKEISDIKLYKIKVLNDSGNLFAAKMLRTFITKAAKQAAELTKAAKSGKALQGVTK